MQWTQIPPRLPSFARRRALRRAFGGNSPLRALEYELLVQQPLAGRVLDVGGGARARTSRYLPKGLTLDSVNIDPAIEPTYLIDADGRYPVPDASYDAVICLNTLEHVYDTCHSLREIRRVLRPEAQAHITVPWMFRIHAHPDDYSRHTPSWWRESLSRSGYRSATLTPLVWGRAVSAGEIAGNRTVLPTSWVQEWRHLRDIAQARVALRGKSHYEGPRGDRMVNIAMGWFISATA